MSLNATIITLLASLQVPVSVLKYSGSAQQYITFFEYMAQGAVYADNTEKETNHFYQIDIFSKTDYTTLVSLTKSLLIAGGFRRTYETEMYESDTSLYHKVLRMIKNEEVQ